MPTTTDDTSLDAARARFTALLARSGDRVRPLARRLLGQDADDGLQEVFAATLRSLPGFRGEAQATTWFHRIAVRVLTAYRRRRDVHLAREQPDEDPLVHLRDDTARTLSSSPLTHLAAAERKRRVLTALDRLPPHLREVLLLRGEGLAYAEIATTLELPLGTVKSRMASATIALAERLPDREELLP